MHVHVVCAYRKAGICTQEGRTVTMISYVLYRQDKTE